MTKIPLPSFVLLISLLFIVGANPAWALSSDRSQTIKILADELEIDETRHISIYQGNVDMRQGSLHIVADRIVFHFTEQNDIEWLEITGTPATLNQLNNNNEPVTGTALNINYFESKSIIELLGDAEFKSSLDTINSNKIKVNTETDALQAGGKKPNERVEMLIYPKN